MRATNMKNTISKTQLLLALTVAVALLVYACRLTLRLLESPVRLST